MEITEVEYAERDLEELGDHYTKHIVAMTLEELKDKSAIAAELAFRDKQIEELKAKVSDGSTRATFTNRPSQNREVTASFSDVEFKSDPFGFSDGAQRKFMEGEFKAGEDQFPPLPIPKSFDFNSEDFKKVVSEVGKTFEKSARNMQTASRAMRTEMPSAPELFIFDRKGSVLATIPISIQKASYGKMSFIGEGMVDKTGVADYYNVVDLGKVLSYGPIFKSSERREGAICFNNVNFRQGDVVRDLTGVFTMVSV